MIEGVITAEQVRQAMAEGKSGEPLASIVDRDFVHAHADHPLDIVLERLAESGGILPIVARDDSHRLVGVVTADAVVGLLKGRR